jgi:hypothetical protein
MAKTSFPKRRANPRFTFFAEAELTLSNGTPVLGQLSELSAGGRCIDTLQPIPIGTELRLSISGGTGICELPGKVIYVNSGGGLGIFGVGVVFGEMSVDQHSAIDMWLREVARRSYSAEVPNRSQI